MESLKLEEEKIIKDLRNLFGLKKLKQLKISDNLIKDKISKILRIFFSHEEEDYYKPVRVSNFW